MTSFKINNINTDAGGPNWINTDKEDSITAAGFKRRLLEGDLRV
ncbi:hypothetical protein [Haladaptatus sp. T7]|nr:hypothetical protein [Haladaptatus sp. T7]GKZ16088.1 hypothetical protein HAL_39690 [Haladaptatus sp. T7]